MIKTSLFHHSHAHLTRVNTWMKNTGVFCLAGMVLVTLCDIIGRNMGYPLFGSEEITSFLAALVISLSIPYAHQNKVHISVEIVERRLPETVKSLLKICVEAFSFILSMIITWRMTLYARTKKKSGELSMNLEIPEYIIIACIAFGFLILTFNTLINLTLFIKTELKGESLT